MEILNSTMEEMDEIFRLYAIATEYMKSKGMVHWPPFERSLVETEIRENRQWKIKIDGQVACVWATTFEDPDIWEERNADPSVYIHRIATSPAFRGRNLVSEIVAWSKSYARQNGKKFVRLDTVGNNQGLIAHYQRCGFDFMGLFSLRDVSSLPAHYQQGPVSLFQISLDRNR